MRRWRQQLIVCLCLVLGWSGVAVAAPADPAMNSGSYTVIESEIGGSGCSNTLAGAPVYNCGASGSYSLNPNIDDGGSSLGENAVGNSASAGFQSSSGFNTTAQPGLTVSVDSTPADLSLLSISAAKTATATFNVKDYTTWGYAVTIIGTPPTYGAHTLTAMGTQSSNSTGCAGAGCSSVPGTEQFGINLRQNPSLSVGADPVPIPSAAFSQYLPANVLPLPYRTQDSYRYFSGDTIASAVGNSGETDYTISFMANIQSSAPVTPNGSYSGNFTIVATGTY